MRTKSVLFSTIIDPPLVFGITTNLAFLLLTLLFLSVILVRAIFGIPCMIIAIAATIYFYFLSSKKTEKDPYWLNIIFLAMMFEKKNPSKFPSISTKFLLRVLSKKEKILYR